MPARHTLTGLSDSLRMRRLIASMTGLKPSRVWWLTIAASAIMWLVVTVSSGLGVVALLVFTAPAAALGLFLRWASCLFTPSRWNWRVATHAAIASAMLLPPLLAALVTFGGLQRPEELLPLFVLGAWIVLAVGLLAAVFASPTERALTEGQIHDRRRGAGEAEMKP